MLTRRLPRRDCHIWLGLVALIGSIVALFCTGGPAVAAPPQVLRTPLHEAPVRGDPVTSS
jgi:hypothetical protein